MGEEYPICDCSTYYGSHPPDCPVRREFTTLRARLKSAREVLKEVGDNPFTPYEWKAKVYTWLAEDREE